MQIKIFKLANAGQDEMYKYQLIIFDIETRSEIIKDFPAADKQVICASIIATIHDEIFHLREREYLNVFKSCLREYARLNRTIRESQILSNLKYATKGFENHVKFKLQNQHCI